MVERFRSIRITVNVETSHTGYTRDFDNIADAGAYLESIVGGMVPRDEAKPAKPRFGVSKLSFHPTDFQVFDMRYSRSLLRGTEAECLSYAESLNNHNLKKEG